MKNNKKIFLKALPAWAAFIFGVVFAGLFFGFSCWFLNPQFQNEKKEVLVWQAKKEKKDLSKSHFIDGVKVSKNVPDFYPLAVTVENHLKARPQAGLADANLVIEAPVEGGITRFLAFFADGKKIKNIGPIRSARPYFLDWVQEFGALYAHVGGSPEALQTIKNNPEIHSLDQYFQGRYYWRSLKRKAPHNVYSSYELLSQAMKDLGLEKVKIEKWKFKDDTPEEEKSEKVLGVIIDFSTHANQVAWFYQKDRNEYYRYQAGKLHLDEEGKIIAAKNVIIQKTSVISQDKEDRKKIKTIGSGEALIFLDGKIIQGFWKKPCITKRTKFYSKEEEVAFNRGVSWIEVVDKNTNIKIKRSSEDFD